MPTLNEMSWAEIAQLADNGEAQGTLRIGDTKKVELYTGEVVELVIVGINHDDKADGSGKAGITFTTKDLLDGRWEMNAEWTNAGGWDKSRMRTVYMERFFRLLPAELQAVIKTVEKDTVDNGEIVFSKDKLFLLSEIEVAGRTYGAASREGTQYEYYKNESNRIKHRNGNDTAWWWLRSPDADWAGVFRVVGGAGGLSSDSAARAYGVCLGFCV